MTTWQEKFDLVHRLNRAMNRAPASADGQRAADAVVGLFAERDATIATLRARLAEVECERDAAVEGKAEVFFAVEDRERFEATIARLKAEVQELGDLLLAERTSRNRVMAAKVVAHEQHQKENTRLTRALAAGPAALRKYQAPGWLQVDRDAAADEVEAAQRAVMEEP